MAFRRKPDSGREAVLWLATAFVVLQGAAVAAFLLLAAFDNPSWKTWAVWAALFGGVSAGLWLMNYPLSSMLKWQDLSFWLSTQDRTDPLETYRFRRRRSRNAQPTGTNQPPTLESLREAADNSPVRWVPHGPPPERRQKRG